MKRRTFLKGLGAAAAASTVKAPALAQSAKARTLIFAPTAPITVVDPHFSNNTPTFSSAALMYETPYSVDSKLRAKPQMVEGHTVSSDKLTWDLKLRPGQKFHDGERVLAKDCVASIKRWSDRDGFGNSLMASTNELIAVDDNTFRFRLKKPFNILPDALAHPASQPCAIMPERLASMPSNKAITEVVGSGPYKFVAGEFVPGQRAVFEKNTAYVPRQEPPDGMAGGKVVNFDRFEWRYLPDAATAAAALQSGEIDWWDVVQFDLIDVLKANRDVSVKAATIGAQNYIRFQCGQKPFNNAALRRAVASAITQTDFTQSLVGADPTLQKDCFAMYLCGQPGVQELGKALMDTKKDYKKIAEDVKKAGYAGEKVVLLRTADVATLSSMATVLADVLAKIGIDCDMQSLDLNTSGARRASNEPLEKGGWSMFIFQTSPFITANPLTAIIARGLGPKGYTGNYLDPTLESYISDWIAAPNEQEQLVRLNKVHQRLWDEMPLVPLGSYNVQTAMRANLTGYIQNPIAVPWNIKRV